MVDDDAFEVADEEVAHDPQGKLGFLVDERRPLGAGGAALERRPELGEQREVALELLLGRALGGGADDDPALGQVELLRDRLQALALGVLEAARDADPLAERRVDEEAAGQRDLRREPGALRPHRVLDRLDEHFLAALDELLDAAAVALALELRDDDLVHVEEPVASDADVDERRLHAGKHVVDDALVDVAGDRPAARALEVDLGGNPVLDHGDGLFHDLDRDVDLLLHVSERGTRAGRRRASRLAPPALRLLLLGLPSSRGLGGLLGDGYRRGGIAWTLASAAASVAATALRAAVGAGLRRVRLTGAFYCLRLGRCSRRGRPFRGPRLLAKPLEHGVLLSGAHRSALHPCQGRASRACQPQKSSINK